MLSFCSFSCGLCACDKVDVCLALDMSGSVCSMAPAAIDVDASLDGVRRSDVNFIRVGPPGSFIGLTSDCPAGKSSQSGAFECTDCLEGTYQDPEVRLIGHYDGGLRGPSWPTGGYHARSAAARAARTAREQVPTRTRVRSRATRLAVHLRTLAATFIVWCTTGTSWCWKTGSGSSVSG